MDANRYLVLQIDIDTPEEFDNEPDACAYAMRESQSYGEEAVFIVKRINPDGDEKIVTIWFDGSQYT